MASQDRTVPVPESLTKVKGYNTLTLYQMPASPFWYVRMYENGKIFRRSTRTIHKLDAIKFAKNFFGEVQLLKMNKAPANRDSSFEFVARSLHKENKSRLERGEITAEKYIYDEARLENDLLPAFGKARITDVGYGEISGYLAKLSSEPRKLSVNSLKIHLSHIKTVFRHAHRLGVVTNMPAYPTLKTIDTPRPWFSSREYNKLHNTAKARIGTVLRQVGTKGEQARNIELTEELYDLILFMVNTFIRPTDIKVIRHRDVEVVSRGSKYLRLTHPPTKGHADPVISMELAVKVYDRIKARQLALGYGGPDDFVFQPHRGPAQRAYALRTLQRQFDQLLILTDLKNDAQGKSRSLYSLRHTAIMFRLVNAENLDSLTLARNARTSVEMIDRFYARPLTAEMNVVQLQSQRSKKKQVAEDDEDEEVIEAKPTKKKKAAPKD